MRKPSPDFVCFAVVIALLLAAGCYTEPAPEDVVETGLLGWVPRPDSVGLTSPTVAAPAGARGGIALASDWYGTDFTRGLAATWLDDECLRSELTDEKYAGRCLVGLQWGDAIWVVLRGGHVADTSLAHELLHLHLAVTGQHELQDHSREGIDGNPEIAYLWVEDLHSLLAEMRAEVAPFAEPAPTANLTGVDPALCSHGLSL